MKESLEHICLSDRDSTTADFRLRAYYRSGGSCVWVDRGGVDSRADTLVATLRRELRPMGFAESAFRLPQIEADLRLMRSLDFDGDRSASRVAARLEYNLSKAYLRYAYGQRYGFVNPSTVLNRFDVLSADSTGRPLSYVRLFDIAMQQPPKSYAADALRQASPDSLVPFLASLPVADSLYSRYVERLSHTADHASRLRLLCNMERRRWRERLRPDGQSSYVLVNLPAYHLWAVSPDTVLDMRVGCGAVKTKTPLLTSYIERMDVNPNWVIPMSIVQNDIARHGGDASYFERRRYFITERKSGQRVAPSTVSSDMLLSGQYRVAQEGGAGNSLGRIIFRFANNFSVFLHDTNSREFFGRDNRGVSHGCVRVQKPFELARFLLTDPDEWLLDKLRISMDLPPETERGQDYVADEANREKTRLVSSLKVSPRVPLYITYYTVYPDPQTGALCTYPDVYGYDKALGKALAPYMK